MSRTALNAVVVCAILAMAIVAFHLREVLAIMVSAVLVSAAVEPLVRRLTTRHISHRLALGLGYTAVISIGFVAFVLLVRLVVAEMSILGTDLVSEYASMRAHWQSGGLLGRVVADHLPATLNQIPAELFHATPMISATLPLHLFSFFAWTMILAVCWSYAGDHVLALLLSLCSMSYRARLRIAWVKMFGAASTVLRATLEEGVSLLLVHLIGLQLVGVKYAAATAVLIALVRLFPFFGGVAAILVSGFAGATISPWHACATVGLTLACLGGAQWLRRHRPVGAHPCLTALIATMLLLSTGLGVVLAPLLAAGVRALVATLTAHERAPIGVVS